MVGISQININLRLLVDGSSLDEGDGGNVVEEDDGEKGEGVMEESLGKLKNLFENENFSD